MNDLRLEKDWKHTLKGKLMTALRKVRNLPEAQVLFLSFCFIFDFHFFFVSFMFVFVSFFDFVLFLFFCFRCKITSF